MLVLCVVPGNFPCAAKLTNVCTPAATTFARSMTSVGRFGNGEALLLGLKLGLLHALAGAGSDAILRHARIYRLNLPSVRPTIMSILIERPDHVARSEDCPQRLLLQWLLQLPHIVSDGTIRQYAQCL